MHYVNQVSQNLKSFSDEELAMARNKIKSTYKFYWKITQEKEINLMSPRGSSAQANCITIDKVGLAMKAEMDSRRTTN